MSARFKYREGNDHMEDLKQPQQQQQFIYIDYKLDNTDTLHAIAMKFGVLVSDLKRLNNLQNDRDIYALKSVKIPIKPNSYHSELYASQLKYSNTILTRLSNGDFELLSSQVERKQASNVDESSGDDTTALLVNSASQDQAREAKQYLRKFDTNVESLITQNKEVITFVINNHKAEFEELVPISNISYSVESRYRSLKNNALFNLSVQNTIIFAIMILIIFPLVIVIYRNIHVNESEHNS